MKKILGLDLGVGSVGWSVVSWVRGKTLCITHRFSVV